MDLRTIMNSEASGAAKPQPPPPSQHSPARQHSEPLSTPRPQVLTPGPASYQSGYFARPPQPSIQPPQHSPSASSTHILTQSPLQYNSTTTLAGGSHSNRTQSSPPPTYQLAPRDSTPASPAVFAQPSLASPYTPQSGSSIQQQQSYFNHYPGSQSAQHAPGPHSAHGYSPQPYASESPRPVNAQQSFPPQHQISPPAQRSQPGTPLGPPAGPYQRPPQSARPPSAGENTSAQTSNLWNFHEHQGSEQRIGGLQNYQGIPPQHMDSRQGERLNSTQIPPETERERSVSISPKTIVSRQSLSQDREGITPHRTSIDDDRWRQSPSGSHSHSSSFADHTKLASHTPQPSYPHGPQAMQMSSSPLARQTPSRETPTALIQPIKSEALEVSEVSGRPLKRKKMRYDEPPIYARRVPRGTAKGPIIPNPRPPIAKNSPARLSLHRRSTSVQGAAPSPSTASLQTPARPPAAVNGSTPPNGRLLPPAPAEPVYGLLGPWEPSISGKIPYEEITKVVCDFLFKEVVLRRDLAAGAAGVSATGSGAILEIEAKLGKIVDKETKGRLRLPVMTECVLNTSDYRTAFESSMSLAQHRVMNNFLNEAVKASMPQAGLNRIPLSYAHKKERDTFYELPPNEIPPRLQNYLNPRHKPKVRVTTDQRTGEVLAKIIKCRIADLDVYSPRTNVDWRISVNLEMNFDRDVRQFPISDGGARGRVGGERIKDRMSYRHLAYQIDLTQVGTAESPVNHDFEHELEVELSAAEVRRQGELAMEGNERNQYEDLIKGFVDNVRFLARAVPNA